MKHKVKVSFRDKHTKNFHSANSVFETRSKERAEELVQAGFLHPSEQETKPVRGPSKKEENKEPSVLDQNVEEVKKAVTADFSEEDLKSLLAEEAAGDDRKGVKEHIESLLEDKKE